MFVNTPPLVSTSPPSASPRTWWIYSWITARSEHKRGAPRLSRRMTCTSHEPLVMDDVVELEARVIPPWRHDSPKLWDYNDGIVMEAYVLAG